MIMGFSLPKSEGESDRGGAVLLIWGVHSLVAIRGESVEAHPSPGHPCRLLLSG